MSTRRKFKESYEQARASLQSVLSPLDFNHICSTLETKASKLKDRLSRKLEVKFNNLKRKYGIPLVSNLNSDDIIFNYSHRVLTEAEKMVLAEGRAEGRALLLRTHFSSKWHIKMLAKTGPKGEPIATPSIWS